MNIFLEKLLLIGLVGKLKSFSWHSFYYVLIDIIILTSVWLPFENKAHTNDQPWVHLSFSRFDWELFNNK